MSTVDIKEVVKEQYGQAALRVKTGGSSRCGAAPSGIGRGCDPITSNLYEVQEPRHGRLHFNSLANVFVIVHCLRRPLVLQSELAVSSGKTNHDHRVIVLCKSARGQIAS